MLVVLALALACTVSSGTPPPEAPEAPPPEDGPSGDAPLLVTASGATVEMGDLGGEVDLAMPPIATFEADPVLVAEVLRRARAWLGTPYAWGGRGTEDHPGLDCLGLLYRSWGDATGVPWRRFPVDPHPLVGSGRLGRPVPGLDGVIRARVDPRLLRPGDVLYLLLPDYRLNDLPLWTDAAGTPWWPWHTALYAGGPERLAVHADPSGVVREQALSSMVFAGLFVTRVPAAAP